MSTRFELIEAEEVEKFKKSLEERLPSLLSEKVSKYFEEITDPDRILAWLRRRRELGRLVTEVALNPTYREMWRREYTKCLRRGGHPDYCHTIATNTTIDRFLEREEKEITKLVKAYLVDNIKDMTLKHLGILIK